MLGGLRLSQALNQIDAYRIRFSICRAISRLASAAFIAWRLSCFALPLHSPSSSLAFPSLKYRAGDQREAFFHRPLGKPLDFAAMQQQLAGSLGAMEKGLTLVPLRCIPRKERPRLLGLCKGKAKHDIARQKAAEAKREIARQMLKRMR